MPVCLSVWLPAYLMIQFSELSTVSLFLSFLVAIVLIHHPCNLDYSQMVPFLPFPFLPSFRPSFLPHIKLNQASLHISGRAVSPIQRSSFVPSAHRISMVQSVRISASQTTFHPPLPLPSFFFPSPALFFP